MTVVVVASVIRVALPGLLAGGILFGLFRLVELPW